MLDPFLNFLTSDIFNDCYNDKVNSLESSVNIRCIGHYDSYFFRNVSRILSFKFNSYHCLVIARLVNRI